MLAVFEGLWLQTGKPWVQQMGSCPACNRVVDGETLSLEACPVSPLDILFSFLKMYLVLLYLQTLAMSLGCLSLEMGVVISLSL